MEKTLEKEFEMRKAQHMINAIQIYLSHMYFNKVKTDKSNVPYPIVQMAIAEQVVNDLEGIILAGKVQEEYVHADKYLTNHNLDMDDFVTET